jgi:hypothetical protein
MAFEPLARRLLGIPFSQLVGAKFGVPHTPGGAIEIQVVAGGAPRVAEMRVVVDVKDGNPTVTGRGHLATAR